MTPLILASTASLALFVAPALAQDTSQSSGTTQSGESMQSAGASDGGDAHAAAVQSAQDVGLQNVRSLDSAFVLEGDMQSGTQIYMIVGQAGELLAVATPLSSQGAAGASGETGAQTNAEPVPGEPAQSGYMATQVNPATPGMWDPVQVEGAMRNLELGLRGVAGEVPQQ